MSVVNISQRHRYTQVVNGHNFVSIDKTWGWRDFCNWSDILDKSLDDDGTLALALAVQVSIKSKCDAAPPHFPLSSLQLHRNLSPHRSPITSRLPSARTDRAAIMVVWGGCYKKILDVPSYIDTLARYQYQYHSHELSQRQSLVSLENVDRFHPQKDFCDNLKEIWMSNAEDEVSYHGCVAESRILLTFSIVKKSKWRLASHFSGVSRTFDFLTSLSIQHSDHSSFSPAPTPDK